MLKTLLNEIFETIYFNKTCLIINFGEYFKCYSEIIVNLFSENIRTKDVENIFQAHLGLFTS
jgi:hypothetical protein